MRGGFGVVFVGAWSLTLGCGLNFPMISQILTIARNTFVESVRQPIYFLIIFICGLLQILNTWGSAFAMGFTESGEVSNDDKLLLDLGLATVFGCGTLLAAFIATAVISREIQDKTVLTVVSKPVGRPVLVFGKFTGVAAAMLIAVVTMLLFVQLAIRHKVLSTAADELDVPVLVFSVSAALIALGVAVWCNFFYGWVFSQTASLLLFPLMALAWVLTLLVGKHWEFQAIGTDFKPQITMACVALVFAQLVMTAAATAASSRLGQVMTIVVCAGLFVFGLLSNHLIGRHAYSNEFVTRIRAAEPIREVERALSEPGDGYRIEMSTDPRGVLKVGMPVYYSPNPGGYPLLVRYPAAYSGSLTDRNEMFDPRTAGSLVITEIQGNELTIRRVGGGGLDLDRPPEPLDYLFTEPTRVNAMALGLWGVVPNVQFFWLLDAVTQNQPIPPRHLLLVGLYALAQTGALLSLAVVLFQTREVG